MCRLKDAADLIRSAVSLILPEMLLAVVCWRADVLTIVCAMFAYVWLQRQAKQERKRLEGRIERLESVRMEGSQKFIFSMRITEHKDQ